ncbi:MAG: type IX secretion system membrane protein PorP/SprF [Sediminibacterium sp.]|nr:type IX secretion system membrane protein PorP/SprF [Sediminibacterium sp.]
MKNNMCKCWLRFCRRSILFFVAVSLTHISAFAQDPHFSQFYASPLLLNPALTGAFPGNLRLSGCYRDQWSSIMVPYKTGTFSVDANLLHEKIQEGDILGIGITGLFDNSNNGGLRSNTLSPSIAFHKVLYSNDGIQHSLGAGFMASMNTKIVDYSRFTFSQQFSSQGFNPNLPTGESKNGFSSMNFDYSAGLLYSIITEDNSLYFGGSMYHINTTKEPVNSPFANISPRYVLHAGGSLLINGVDRLYLSGVYMNAQSYRETILGVVYGYGLTNTYNYDNERNDITVMAGVWYRHQDAIIPYLGMEWGNARVGLSYDINVSQLTAASKLRGGFELSLSYTLATTEAARIRKRTLCPEGKQSALKWYGY